MTDPQPAAPAEPTVKARRGTSNSNQRGSYLQRARRREWLVDTYRADVDMYPDPLPEHLPRYWSGPPHGQGLPACRCYRCGVLLTVDTVTVDRIIPGCKGGTYRRTNIRPACGRCNSETGARLGHANTAAKKAEQNGART